MLLADVLRVLAGQTDALGYRRADLYDILFRGILDEQNFGLDDTVKQLFSGGRPLNSALMRLLYEREGFDLLRGNIQVGYLTVAGNHTGIFDSLSALLADCPYMRAEDVKKITSSCDAARDDELARFIAACLVCGSYNTAQSKKDSPQIRESYALNLDYMRLDTPASVIALEEALWSAAQASFISSRSEGGRFYKLDIIERLLPQGHFTSMRFTQLGKTDEGEEAPLTELCARSDSDIAVVGDGGIGKTTFLQHLMEEIFLLPGGGKRANMDHRSIPFFIELNRCPDHVGDWYDDSLRKTNFITRYIGQIKENHASLDSVSPDTLTQVEKELQRIPADGKPRYLLLLDGFNEVRSNNSVRTYLSNEISILHRYPNVRIITTSRETQAAYYASEFENIHLVGLKNEDIITHLENSGVPQPVIGSAMACDSLVKCLRIPLYLCMFSARDARDDFLPETAGEILYSFFHRNSAFYNIRSRIAETRSSELTEEQIAFVLDFILPFIGWQFETSDAFSMNEREFKEIISEAMCHTRFMLASGDHNPFADFKYSGARLRETAESFYAPDGLDVSLILSCVYDYLGIVYQYQVNEGAFADRIRYAFCHHHFRDYFSAMWDVQLLSMLRCADAGAFAAPAPGGLENNTFQYFLDERYWQTQKVGFISEVLMEHRNKPKLDAETQNWFLPEKRYDEQRVLTAALDYCRELRKAGASTKHILQNILAAILYGRKEYSGLDLSGLDLSKCSLFNITCSRRGATRYLAANFEGSVFSNKTFEPEDHRDSVMEYLYHGKQCFTIDDGGGIKCWDVLSGRLEYELQSADPLGVTDFSGKGFFKISNDGHWLAAKVQETYPGGTHVYIHIFDLTNPDSPPRQIKPDQEHNLLTYFAFTEDSKSILMLCDRKVIYCMDVTTGTTLHKGTYDLLKQSELYADSAESEIYVYTAEYDAYETNPALMRTWTNSEDDNVDDAEDWDYSTDEDDEEEFPDGILCELCVIVPNTGELRELYTFSGEPGVSPTISYIPHGKCFLLYNHDGGHIERFDCLTERSEIILQELTDGQDTPPTEIHPHPERAGECFVMYPNVCFAVDIRPGSGGNVLMTYAISGVEKLLPDSDESGELEFKTSAVPAMNRFVVGNDTNTYEWDTENDTLIRKYNSVFYDCTAFFCNATKDTAILVHRHNGVSLFAGSPAKLRHQYCFQEPGYVIDISCYDETHNTLAMVFARPDHEKVLVMDVDTGEEREVFSSFHPGETIENLCFSNDGDRLLATTQYRCLECDPRHGSDPVEVAIAGDNERFAAGNYRGDEIEIAVVEHIQYAEPHVTPHCVYYRHGVKDGKPSFQRTWCYIMPQLKKEQFCYFLYRNGDLGVGGANDAEGFQTYWVTSGFFLERLPELEKILQPQCYKWQGNRRLKLDKTFQPLDEIFVWHDHEITNRYGVGNSGFSYMYLADDMSEAVITDNREYLSYQRSLEGLTYQRLRDSFQNDFKDVHQDTYWSYAIPWHDGSLIGCFEGYNLTHVAASDNKLLDSIAYYPGISIFGCRFKGIQADDETRDVIAANGGIL